jgi:hypothetical protein
MIKEVNEYGTIRYYNDNYEPHREDGPAVEFANGTKLWYLHGIPHREGGPAAEYPDGDIFWFKYGNLHREDGPAAIYSFGAKEYWYEGFYIKECDSDEFLKKWIQLKAFR